MTYVRPRARRPIYGTAAPRSKQSVGGRSLGDAQAYATASRWLGRVPKYAAGARVPRTTGMLDAQSDYEYGMGNWFTDIFTKPIDVPGVTEPRDIVPVQFNAWRELVLKRNHQVTKMPSGPLAGEWAERVVDPNLPAGDPRKILYAVAPQAVRDEMHKIQGMEQQQVVLGARAARTESILKNLTPPKLIENITGIPSWLVPVLLIGGGFMVLRSVLPPSAPR